MQMIVRQTQEKWTYTEQFSPRTIVNERSYFHYSLMALKVLYSLRKSIHNNNDAKIKTNNYLRVFKYWKRKRGNMLILFIGKLVLISSKRFMKEIYLEKLVVYYVP